MVYHYFNREAGTTVAIVKGTKWDAVNTIVRRHPVLCKFREQLVDGKDMEMVKKFRLDRYVIPNQFKSVAHCHAEDTFSEEAGREIADAKLFEKLNSSIEKAMFKWAVDQMVMMQNNVFAGEELFICSGDDRCDCGCDCGGECKCDCDC